MNARKTLKLWPLLPFQKDLLDYFSKSNHHHVALSAWISLSHHSPLLFITPGRSSRLYPVSAQSCCRKVNAGHPTFACPCEGVHRSISLMSSSLLLQRCPACLVHLTRIVFVMGCRWPYSCSFVGWRLKDLFNTARSKSNTLRILFHTASL